MSDEEILRQEWLEQVEYTRVQIEIARAEMQMAQCNYIIAVDHLYRLDENVKIVTLGKVALPPKVYSYN